MTLPKKPKAVFNHPMGFELYDGLAMDLHAVTHSESLARENDGLRELLADIKTWDVSQYITIPHDLRARIESALTPNARLSGLPLRKD